MDCVDGREAANFNGLLVGAVVGLAIAGETDARINRLVAKNRFRKCLLTGYIMREIEDC